MKHTTLAIVCLAILFNCTDAFTQSNIPKFERQTIDDQIEIGYGIAAGDVDGDNLIDLVLADKRQIIWYQNPGKKKRNWNKHVIAENLTRRDNVCIAVRDLDGDNKAEIAVGAQWNPADTSNAEESGALFYLVAPDDRSKKWEPLQIQPHDPTTHRMRWLVDAKQKAFLIVLPLHGIDNKQGAGKPVRVAAYAMPENPRDRWPMTVLDESQHLTHNMDIRSNTKLPNEKLGELILVAGKEDVRLIEFTEDSSTAIHSMIRTDESGSGEVRIVNENDIVTIEPMHGSSVVFYHKKKNDSKARFSEFHRVEIDDSLAQGHALGVGDFLGSDQQQVVAGWRNKNADGDVGIKCYVPSDESMSSWESHWVDRNGMACEDLQVIDLNGDGKLDIVASGRATKNVVIYWNVCQ